MNLIVEILTKLGFDWKLALMNLVNIGLIFLLLRKFLFGTIGAKIEERRKRIIEGLENAKSAEAALQMANQKSEQLLLEAKKQANELLAAAQKHADGLAEHMKDEARKEIELLVAQAKKTIEIDRKEMESRLRDETVSLVLVAVEKILKEKATSSHDAVYVKNLVKDLA